ncbi:MAG TPA: hypothetical protein VGQ57_11050 [Polyangiaceae bacterium]|nr:hypothetical protein [Polyangiaceae bacterium]
MRLTLVGFGFASALTALAVACGSNGDDDSGTGGGAGTNANAGTAGQAMGGSAGTTTDNAGTAGQATGEAGAPPFEHPDPPSEYVPQDGKCGFDKPAFCETFETGPHDGGRSGELDAKSWSVVRGMPYNSSSFDDAFRLGPALIGACRKGLENTTVLPDSDVLVCDPTATVPTRHALATAAAQNYGLSTYRIRQPFDFEGRTGTIKLDIDLTNNGLGGWPALVIAEDPSAAPSFDWQERGSGPRNGVEIEFGTGWCNTPQTLEVILYAFRDYLQTAYVPSFDCDIPHATTAPGSLNHVEIYLTQKHLEVWTTDVSSDGVNFPNFHLLWEGDLDLPFSRGYVSLALRNHATIKYWLGSAATLRFDNVGFDGPVVKSYREYSAPDSLTSYTGLPGCSMGAAECQWEGDVIAKNPTDDDRKACADTACTFMGEGRNVGYVVPREDETEQAPAALDFTSVDPSGFSRARLVMGVIYPWFDWNGVSHPPTYITLRYRVNGGDWHDRNVSEVEANAFTDFSPDLGGAGASSGLLNQAIDLDPSELVAGDNRIELLSANTWTGTYRVMVTGADLVFDQPN